MMRPSYRRIAAIGLACALFTCLECAPLKADQIKSGVSESKKTKANSPRQRLWKSAIPRRPVRAEFDGHDPIGLATGAKIKTDCSVNWMSPDTFRRYCFASGTSLVYFLRWPKKNARRAELGWKKINNLSN